MNYAEHVTEHLRITILRLLDESPSMKSNESVIVDAVNEYGFAPSRDKVRTELHWLKEQGLVDLKGESCLVAGLTARGEDVAKCRVVIPGVKRPSLR
jgi:repressor of nif and glnA expression